MAADPYVLGHAPEEIRRLELQAKFLDLPTRHVLDRINLRKGMRVLDIGTGSGDVAILAAEYVGATGEVIAIDRNADVLTRARERAAHLAQVTFHLCSLQDASRFGQFDLVIGRYVACFQEDDVAFLRQAAGLVKPGGIVVFIEPAVAATREASQPPVALYDEAWNWIDRPSRPEVRMCTWAISVSSGSCGPALANHHLSTKWPSEGQVRTSWNGSACCCKALRRLWSALAWPKLRISTSRICKRECKPP